MMVATFTGDVWTVVGAILFLLFGVIMIGFFDR